MPQAYAQQKDPCFGGVFLSENDFVNNRLSYSVNTSEEGYRLSFVFPADLALSLKIVTPDTTYKFVPGSIYGFSECGNLYRYYPGGTELNAQEDFYKIEEAAGLILYSSLFVSGREIFYSTDLTSSIHRLSLKKSGRRF
jgi:hypothetical protein